MSAVISWFRREPRNAAQWVTRIHSGTMAAGDQAALSAWLARRPEHREAFARAEAVWGLAQTLSSSHVARHYLAADVAARRRSRPRQIAFGLGMGLAAAMAVLVLWPDGGLQATGPGEIRTVTLEDGSTVWLNADSRLRVDFSVPFRRVVLERGEAFFKVAHDTSRPFIVEAEPRRIIVTGTEFDVRRASDAVEVSVAEGHVKVETALLRGEAPDPTTSLSAGEDARFVAGQAMPAVAHGAVAQHKGAWREGKIYLDDTQLGAAFDEINRYSPTKLVPADDKLRRLTISGVFHMGDTDSVLFALHELYRLEARHEPGRIVLSLPAG
jgi:transmembrane sensor